MTNGNDTRDIKSGRNAILMYHSVGEEYPDGRLLTKTTFRRQMEYLRENFRVVDLPEVVNPADTERRVALTFDAGYENFYTEILPILEEYDLSSTQFIIPERIGVENEQTNSRSLWIEWFDFMNEDQLRDLASGSLVTIGNKSLTHTSILPAIRDRGTLEREVGGGKKRIRELFDIPVERYCYGSGRFDPKSVEVVRQHHEYGVTTIPRFIDESVDQATLPRIDMDFTNFETFKYKLTRRFEFTKQARSALGRIVGGWHPDAYRRLQQNEPET